MASAPPLFIVGRFPPPLDGQTLATERLASLLAGPYTVHALNTSAPEGAHVAAEVRFRPRRVVHYLGGLRGLRRALRAHPEAPVLWASVSSEPLGHARDLLATLPAFAPGQAVFAVVHRATFDGLFRHGATAATAPRLLRRLRGVVFLDETLAERCAPWIPAERRFVVPNTVDAAVVPPEAALARKLARGRRPLRLLFLSNMMPEKGYADVLEAARRLHHQGFRFHLDLAGRWVREADAEAFKHYVAAHGLEEVVTHHGALTERAAIQARHLAADAFLLPTYHPTEAQPLALIEAMGAATPLIVTRHGGIPQMVTGGAEARFVPPHDPEAIAAAVRELADPALWQARAQAARTRFETTFSPAAVRARWVTMLTQAGFPPAPGAEQAPV